MVNYLKIKTSKTASEVTVYLPVVTNVEDVYTANLTEISTYIYGYRNRFVMDMGVTRKITLEVVRPNPPEYNDSSNDWRYQEQWSNGKWMTKLIELLDPWQNLMNPIVVDGKTTYKGGFALHYESSDKTLMMDFDQNVFLSGSLSPVYGVQNLQFSLPLLVARNSGSKADVPKVTVTLLSNTSPSDTKAITYPEGTMTPAPAVPATWMDLVSDSTSFKNWTMGNTVVWPGQMVEWENCTLSANWKQPLSTRIFSGGDSGTLTVPTGAIRMTVYAVGGGGGAGGWRQPSSVHVYLAGGGGGAGKFIVKSRAVKAGSELIYNVGLGGAGGDGGNAGWAGAAGEDGNPTTVAMMVGDKKVVLIDAPGGKGGQVCETSSDGSPKPQTIAKGGEGYGSGGDAGPGYITGGDGVAEYPNIQSNAGKGGTGGTREGSTNTDYFQGGAGGGASGLNVRIGATPYVSRGGDGGSYYYDDTEGSMVTEPGNGVYGGGGGSGPKSDAGSGGDGLLIVIFYD